MVAGDAFQVLRGQRDAGLRFDVVVLDPPKFATSQAKVMDATRGYKDINLLAMQLLRPGGLLFQAGRNAHFLTIRPDFNVSYLLEPGELYRLARDAGLEVLFHADGTPGQTSTSQLIARRPA